MPSALPMKRSSLRLQQLGRLLDALLALAALLADGQQRHRWDRLTPSTRSAKSAPMCAYWARLRPVESVVAPMSSSTNGPAVGDHLDGQRRPVDALEPAQVEDRRGHAGAGVAGGHDRVGLALLDQAHADVDARVALAPHGGRGVLVHAPPISHAWTMLTLAGSGRR